MTGSPDELHDPARYRQLVADVVRTARAFLRALAADDEAATSRLLLDAAKEALDPQDGDTFAAMCRRALGLTRAACARLGDANEYRDDARWTLRPHGAGIGGMVTIPHDDRTVRIYVMHDAGDWRASPSPEPDPSDMPSTMITVSLDVELPPD